MRIEEIAATAPLARAEFACGRGHGAAGSVALHRAGEEWVVVVESFVCRMVSRLSADQAAALQPRLRQGDAAGVHAVDVELAPFYCAACRQVYCGVCWRTRRVMDDDMPAWVDQTRGSCPLGHDRMLVD